MILVFSLTGCRRGDISIDPDAGTLGLSISETDLNAGLMTLIAAHSNPLFRNPSLDLQPGLVVLNGEHQRRDGQGMVTGSVTLRPSVVEGGIQVAVEQVSVEGVNADDAQVQAFADDFAKLLNNQSALRQRRASITAFTVTDSTLDITFSR
jgi:hypothetical protein